MARKVKIEYPFEPTIVGCKAELERGVIGHIDYHLHKDNSWVRKPKCNKNEVLKYCTDYFTNLL
jgi:hypothetical protein